MKREKVIRAIEHDSDGRIPVVSAARVTESWVTVMREILRMPVPRYEEPKPVSGEILTAAQNKEG